MISEWRRARAVEWAALEMRYTRKGIGGSNPPVSAKKRNRIPKQKYGRREAPSVLYSPHKILILKGFTTLRMAQKSTVRSKIGKRNSEN